MSNILITGANGQLGKAIQKMSYSYDYNFIFANKEILDIVDKDQLEKLIKNKQIDIVINTAAYTAVDRAEDERDESYLINFEAVKVLANICKENDVCLIHISTDYVFDGRNYVPYKEEDKTNPINAYGDSKLKGEQSILSIKPKSIIIRTSWVYSEYGQNFVKTMLNLTKSKNSLRVIYDQIGTPTYAKDLASAILDIIKQPLQDKVEIYHYSNEGVCSWYDFAKAVFDIKGIDINILPITTYEFKAKAKRPHYSVLSKYKIKDHFNIKIPYWRESLKKMLKEYD